MRLIADFSDYQQIVNMDTLAQSGVSGAWVKWADFSWWWSHRTPDDVHAPCIRRLRELGFYVGSYLFVRPNMSSAEYQVDAWADSCPPTSLPPMLDLEANGGLSGQQLTDWVTNGLRRMTERFGVKPVLYSSASFMNGHGMSRPPIPHYLMVAEYHLGYQPLSAGTMGGWEARAMRAYGGPDLPSGYGEWDVWQFTSSAEIAGLSGGVDCSLVTDKAWAEFIGGSADAPPLPSLPPPEDDLTPEQDKKLAEVHDLAALMVRLIDPGYVTGVKEQPSGWLAVAKLLGDQTEQVGRVVTAAIGAQGPPPPAPSSEDLANYPTSALLGELVRRTGGQINTAVQT